VLHAKLRNRTCQGLDRQGQGQGLTSLPTRLTSGANKHTPRCCLNIAARARQRSPSVRQLSRSTASNYNLPGWPTARAGRY